MIDSINQKRPATAGLFCVLFQRIERNRQKKALHDAVPSSVKAKLLFLFRTK